MDIPKEPVKKADNVDILALGQVPRGVTNDVHASSAKLRERIMQILDKEMGEQPYFLFWGHKVEATSVLSQHGEAIISTNGNTKFMSPTFRLVWQGCNWITKKILHDAYKESQKKKSEPGQSGE